MGFFYTDPVEIAAVVTSLLWVVQAVWVAWRSWKTWRYVDGSIPPYIKEIAKRRLRINSFLCLWASVSLLSCIVTLFMPVGQWQSAVRNMAIAINSLFGLFRAFLGYLDQRAMDIPWDGEERRGAPFN